MAILVNEAHPWLRIYLPESGGYARFIHGQLEIDEGDPGYETVMRVAASNPHIKVFASGVEECPECGEKFVGKMAKALAQRHINQKHPESEAASVSKDRKVVKAAASKFTCDVCSPAQPFESEDELALHASVVHAGKPEGANEPEE